MLADLTNSPAFWLGVYSTVVSTAVALLTLYGEVFLRIQVFARLAFFGSDGGPAVHERAEDFPDTGQQLVPVYRVLVRNRGRQGVTIAEVWQAQALRPHRRFAFAYPISPFANPGHTLSLPMVRQADETEKPRRFFVVDAAGRVHPLKERWRMRFEDLVFRQAWLCISPRF